MKTPLDTVTHFAFCFQHSLKISGEEGLLTISVAYLSFVMFRFHSGVFSLSRTFFSNFFRADLLAVNSLSFPSSEAIFISPSFLKDIFLEYRILG